VAKVDLKDFRRQMTELREQLDNLPEAAHAEFVKNTPKRSGNARRNTRLQDTKIIADYAYSQKLDEGYSPKSPQGMTEPTEQWIQKEVDRRLKGL
jgi:hypothetical protein